jgi:amino acid transporter
MKILIPITIIVGLLIIFYKLMQEPKENDKSPPWWDFLKPFNRLVFKIPMGILIISATILQSVTLIKLLPPLVKVLTIGLNFIVIYAVINYLFINKKTNKK